MMNDSLKRRKQLLEETRARYRDDGRIPAVHPRYRAAYDRIYEDETTHTGTFGVRLFVCILLFAAFVVMDRGGQKVMNVSSDRIVEEITTDLMNY